MTVLLATAGVDQHRLRRDGHASSTSATSARPPPTWACTRRPRRHAQLGAVDDPRHQHIAPLTMATAYAGIANHGVVCTPVAIDSITGADGTKIAATPTKCTQGMSTDVADGVVVRAADGAEAGRHGGQREPGRRRRRSSPRPAPPTTPCRTGSSPRRRRSRQATWVGNISGSTSASTTRTSTASYGYDLKFTIDKTIIASLDAAYGGGTLTAPPASEVGSSAVSGSSSSSSSSRRRAQDPARPKPARPTRAARPEPTPAARAGPATRRRERGPERAPEAPARPTPPPPLRRPRRRPHSGARTARRLGGTLQFAQFLRDDGSS